MRLVPLFGLLLLCLPACSDGEKDTGADPTIIDSDDDGYADRYDCDDENPDVHPGADEICDEKDNDCDDRVDEDALGAPRWYLDLDRDGFGDADLADDFEVACEAPVDRHYASQAGDCDDEDAGVNPEAMEYCGDAIDNDCDGEESEEDENTNASSFGTWYLDYDGDGFGSGEITIQACQRPRYVQEETDPDDDSASWGSQAGDCNDTDDLTYPGAGWREDGTYDHDGDPTTAELDVADACTTDFDGDGFAALDVVDPVVPGTDCDDVSFWVNVEGDEICDGADTNCDGSVLLVENDTDGDGYVGCELDVALSAWLGEPIEGGEDCNEDDPLQHPGADEVCNGEDDDCDLQEDEADAVDPPTWYRDLDDDGYFNSNSHVSSCEMPAGYLDAATTLEDCNDANASISPGDFELCNGIDDNCDGAIDEDTAVNASTWYLDADGDTYGLAALARDACTQPTGYVSSSTDCDDSSADIHIAATEVCDGIDNDCDTLIDADDNNVVGDPWYQDADGDTFGNPSSISRACTQPVGFVTDLTDCDDGDLDVNPSAEEICRDETDNDCDGTPGVCTLVGDHLLTDADLTLEGDTSYLYAGSAFAPAGDLDGDGISELLVGMPGDAVGGPDAGAVWLVLGSTSLSDTLDPSGADGSFTGMTVGYRAGTAIAGGVSIGASTTADLAIGSCPGSGASSGNGALHLFFDPTVASFGLDEADLELNGPGNSDLFGCAVSFVGDVDGDTVVDLLVGAPGTSTSAGAAYVLRGPLSATSSLNSRKITINGATTSTGLAGTAVAGGADVNADGNIDLLIGAPGVSTNAGRSYVVLGPVTATVALTDNRVRLTGQSAGDASGSTVALTDFNADGYADMLIGAPGSDVGGTDAGAAYLMLGPVTTDKSLLLADAKLIGAAGDEVGTAVSVIGDVDNDNIDDVCVGGPGTTISGISTGAAWLMLGGTVPSGVTTLDGEAAARFAGIAAGDRAGAACGAAGDPNGDGWYDIAIGAPEVDGGSTTDQGAAYLIWGTSL